MRSPDRWLLLLALVALIAACGRGNLKITGAESVAPDYSIKQDKGANKRMRYQEFLRLSGDRFGRGQLEEALQFARSAQKLEPGLPDAYTMQAVVEGQKGNAEAAGALYRKAAELAPQQGDVLNNYGAWLCGSGHPAEALVWFDRALADPNYGGRADALANAGGCALDAGQRERAEDNLRQALALAPDNAYALEAMTRNEVLHGRYFEARAFYQRRLAAAPATVSVLQLAIQIEERLGDRTAAGRFQQRLREEFPSPATSNPQG